MKTLKTIALLAMLLTAQSYAEIVKDRCPVLIRHTHLTPLVWKLRQENIYRTIPAQMHQFLEKKFGFPCILNIGNLDYLKQLQDSGIEGAKELIELLHEFGEIELNLEVFTF